MSKRLSSVLLLAGTLAHASSVNSGTDWSAVAAKVLPSVVSVEIYRDPDRPPLIYSVPGVRRNWLTDLFDRIAKRQDEPIHTMKATPDGGGAGFCISNGGLIATAGHLFRYGKPKRIVVELADHTRIDANVVGADLSADVAVIRTATSVNCPPVVAANVSKLTIGQPILAVGSPDGYSHSVSVGIVSALREDAAVLPRGKWVQFDAPIYYGNSGGPVFNVAGQVIGMVSYAYGGAAQFAVPIDRAVEVANGLLGCGARGKPAAEQLAVKGGRDEQ